MNRFLLFFSFLFCLAGFGCEGFLNRRLDTNFSEEQVFSAYSRMRDFGLGIYTYVPDGFNHIGGSMLAAASDDALDANPGTTVKQLSNGSWNEYSNPDDQWAHFYAGIRKANLFLENSTGFPQIIYEGISDTTDPDRKTTYSNQYNDINWLRHEARFLRALFYFELSKRYGGVPLVTETLTMEDDLTIERNSYEEITTFIVSECNAIIPHLRDTWSGFLNDQYTGRVTSGAAMALKARVLLYAASPLQNPENDPGKWRAAAEAAHDLIVTNRYSLHPDYFGLFQTYQSSEIIFAHRYGASNDFERANYPIGFQESQGGVNPSQNLVDAYETINGLSIENDPAYDPQNPYADRDPRLGMTIIVNNSTWKGRTIEIWEGGQDGPHKPRGTLTGYYLKKYVDEGIDLVQNTTSIHTWILFRYAEVLLNYAEAMNEAYGPDAIPAGYTLSARDAINLVRSRPGVGMPPVNAANQAQFREKVRNERRVELAFEEHRFWDVRRWEVADETLGEPLRGVSITHNNDGSFTYNYEIADESRVFEDRMYFYPIPQTEINKSEGALEQNAGW